MRLLRKIEIYLTLIMQTYLKKYLSNINRLRNPESIIEIYIKKSRYKSKK